jgi:hypothetical protein
MGTRKIKQYIEVEFLEDFAGNKKGDYVQYDSLMAFELIQRGVAKKVGAGTPAPKKIVQTKKIKKDEKIS